MRRVWGVVSHAATSNTKLVFKSSWSLSNNTRSGFVRDWVQFCWYVGKCSPDNNNIYSYKESSHLTKSSQAENDSFGNNKREKYFLIEHIKQNNERIGEKLDSLYFTLHSLMMMMISLAFLTTSGAVVEDCFHVLDLFFFYFHHTLSRIFFPLAAHAYTAACNTDDNNAGLKIFKRSAWWMFDEEQHTHSLQHASLQSVDTARHVF